MGRDNLDDDKPKNFVIECKSSCVKSREKNLGLIVLALIFAIVFWNTFWFLPKFMLAFIVAYSAYALYKIFRSRF